MARVSCPSVSSGSLGISYPWFVPVYPTAIACGFGELITLVGPFSPYSHCFGVCFAQEETCVMRPWHHQAANSRVFFNAHKCKVPSFMLVKTIRMSFVPMMKPRVYSLFYIVVAYFFIPSCRIIPCLILSSLPLSQLSGHLLCSPISSPWFPFLYSFFYTLLPPLYYYPYATLIPVVAAYSSSMAYREDMRFHELSMRCFGFGEKMAKESIGKRGTLDQNRR